MASKICSVCNIESSKYKCPTCLIPYCSLVCFRKHKETPCQKPDLDNSSSTNTAASSKRDLPPPRPINPSKLDSFGDDLEDTSLDMSQLLQLSTHPKLKSLLTTRLREILVAIDSESDVVRKEIMFDEALRDVPEFCEFCDACLDSVGYEREGEA